jgi:predicted deacylase
MVDGRNLNGAFLNTDYNELADLTRAPTQQLAAVLTKEFLAHLDYHIDFHTGGSSHCVHSIDFGDDPVVFGMARAFNQPILMRDYWLPEQIWGKSDLLGIKMICAECGGGGQLYDEWLERNVRGTFNVMRQLGMLPGEVERPPKQYVVDRTEGNEHNLQVRLTREGGLFIPDPKITAHLAFRGEPLVGVPTLGRLQNMYDLTIRQEIENPFERTLLLGTPVAPTFCHPGDLLFLLADADAAEVLD